jgi:hypothetical protein
MTSREIFKRASILIFAWMMSQPAEALPIHLHRHLGEYLGEGTTRAFIVASMVAMLVAAVICFRRRLHGVGLLLIVMILYPWIVGIFFELAGIPVRWW